MKLSVITVSYNQPDFISYQYLLLKKYLKCEFDFTVYNNSDIESIRNDINSVCTKNKINNFNIPQEIYNNINRPSFRAGKSLDYAISHNLKNFNNDFLLVLDSDMFLIDSLDIENYLSSDFTGIKQYREHVYYYTNQLFLANLNKLKDFDNVPKFIDGVVDGQFTDCGGHLFYYFNSNKEIIHNNFNNRLHSETLNFNDIENLKLKNDILEYFKTEIDIVNKNKNFSELFDYVFLHFRAGTNWINFNSNIVEKRKNNLINFLNKRLNDEKNN